MRLRHICITRCVLPGILFYSNNFVELADLMEVCSLLSAFLVTLRAKLSGAVYCNRSCLYVYSGRADGVGLLPR